VGGGGGGGGVKKTPLSSSVTSKARSINVKQAQYGAVQDSLYLCEGRLVIPIWGKAHWANMGQGFLDQYGARLIVPIWGKAFWTNMGQGPLYQ